MAETPLYICDLDGTLLRSDGALSEFARDGLNELLSAGIRLTVASSRATPAMRALLAGVNLRLPVIEFNGAFVSELESGRHLASNVLSNSVACVAVEAILATGTDPGRFCLGRLARSSPLRAAHERGHRLVRGGEAGIRRSSADGVR